MMIGPHGNHHGGPPIISCFHLVGGMVVLIVVHGGRHGGATMVVGRHGSHNFFISQCSAAAPPSVLYRKTISPQCGTLTNCEVKIFIFSA